MERREKGDGGLREVLTPLTGPVYETSLHRLERRNAEKVKSRNAEKVQEAKRRRRERTKRWKKVNPEKVKEQKKRWRERNREKVRENKDRWRKANPEKVKECRKRYRERANARLEVDEERLRETRKKAREPKQRWRKANPEKVKECRKRYRKAHPEKVKEFRKKRSEASREAATEREREYYQRNKERLCEVKRAYRRNNKEKYTLAQKKWRAKNREAKNERSRQYYHTHKEQCNEARRKRYAKQKRRPVPRLPLPQLPPSPPCDCGLCLACGGWVVTWKPDWHARLKAWSTPGLDSAKEDQPLGELEDLPLDLLESEAETLSTASTSEIESKLWDRLETLLADESDSEVETGPATAPTRRSSRIAAMPTVSYLDWEDDPMPEILRRKAKLHSEAADRIFTRRELLDHRTDRVNAIVEEMSVCVDPHHELDRFQAQLERQEVVMDVIVNEELFDFIGGQL